MDKFASQGLRTLMFGMRELPSDTTKETLENMPHEDFEGEITLLGVTGLEDLLQDDVKQCICEFREAKIKVWMLTGDKGETAETIGISCGLIDDKKQ
jgi:magnesium-transporting ATPase (P-type)